MTEMAAERHRDRQKQGETQRHGDRRERELETNHSHTEAQNRASYQETDRTEGGIVRQRDSYTGRDRQRPRQSWEGFPGVAHSQLSLSPCDPGP